MAKATRRVANKSLKRHKRHAASGRRKVTKRAAPKKAKSKLRNITRVTRKSTARKKPPLKAAERKAHDR